MRQFFASEIRGNQWKTNSLHYFAEAAKELNFTKTAKRLFISQQNLSHHIARLEEYFEVQLFERKPWLALTYAGEVLLAYAEWPSMYLNRDWKIINLIAFLGVINSNL